MSVLRVFRHPMSPDPALRKGLIILLFVAALAPSASATNVEFMDRVPLSILEQLPPEAVVETYRGVFAADLTGDGVREVIVCYYLPRPEDQHYHRSVAAIFSGGEKVYVDDPGKQAEFHITVHALGTPVADVDADGNPELVLHRGMGRFVWITCVRWEPEVRQFRAVPRIGPREEGYESLVDLDGDGVYEIQQDLEPWSLPNVYRWDGCVYRIANFEFSGQYEETTASCEKLFLDESDSPGTRLSLAERVIEGRIRQKEYDKASAAVAELLRLAEAAESEGQIAQAYRYLGDILMDQGREKEAKAAWRIAAGWENVPSSRRFRSYYCGIMPFLARLPDEARIVCADPGDVEESFQSMIARYQTSRGLPEEPRDR